MKTQTPYLTLDAKGRATLPEEVRSALGVEAGDIILLEATDHGTFEMTPARLVPRDQLWFHDPAIRKRVEAAEEDFAAGRSVRTETVDEAQVFLDSLKQQKADRRDERKANVPRGRMV